MREAAYWICSRLGTNSLQEGRHASGIFVPSGFAAYSPISRSAKRLKTSPTLVDQTLSKLQDSDSTRLHSCCFTLRSIQDVTPGSKNQPMIMAFEHEIRLSE